jgi:hypothetical protein
LNKIILVTLLTVILLSTSLTKSHANADTGKKKIASFVDPKKDPQSYVKRYQSEPTYKTWFDKNYGSTYKNIYEAVGLSDPSKKVKQESTNDSKKLDAKISTDEKSKSEIKKLQVEYAKLKSENTKLKFDYEKLKSDHSTLSSQYDFIHKAYLSNLDAMKKQDTAVNQQYDSLTEYEKGLEKWRSELEKLANEQTSKPLTIINDQKVNWYVSDSKGNRYSWSLPMADYDDLVRYQPYESLRLSNVDTGEIYTVQNHMLYVKTSFTKVIDQVYDNAKNDQDFAYEVWYIVSQLTTYSKDIDEDPRWALETLTRGGGDCEDTTILIADMLKSSKHTKDWKIQLVYFDADNPEHPKTINHIAVKVNDGESQYILESTNKVDPYPWKGTISSWHFDV